MHNYLCSNCGEKINDSYNICPVCNAINYKNPEIIKMYQKKYNPSAVEGYKILFIVLIVIIVVGNIVIGALIFPF